MAYSEIEQFSRDLDIFFSDGTKYIHLASGGGKLPSNLIDTDLHNEIFLEFINIRNAFDDIEIEINPTIKETLNLSEEDLNAYLKDFIRIAKHGFFTYDKTNLGEFEDFTFHLVAKPKNIFFKQYQSRRVVRTELVLPDSYEPFNLLDFVK